MNPLDYVVHELSFNAYGGPFDLLVDAPVLRALYVGAPGLVAWFVMALIAVVAWPPRRSVPILLALGVVIARIAVEIAVWPTQPSPDIDALFKLIAALVTSGLHAAQWALTLWSVLDPLAVRAGLRVLAGDAVVAAPVDEPPPRIVWIALPAAPAGPAEPAV